MIAFDQLESRAREICDSRNGSGHYEKSGVHRNHWREIARADIEQQRAISTADALMGIFGFRRVEG